MGDNAVLSVVEAVESVIRQWVPEGQIAHLHRPFIGSDDAENVARCVSNDAVGYEYIDAFEEGLRHLTGARFAIAVSSGTAALHLGLLALCVEPGEIVGMPSLTFAAGAAAVRYCGASPGFGLRTAPVVMAVDLLGEIDPMLEGKGVQPAEGTLILEDAAEALGSTYGGRMLGTFGHIGVLSFNNNKIVTTGGGGAVLTDDESYATKMKWLATTARDPSRQLFFEHTGVGYNYRMPNVCAAMGLGQLQRLDRTLEWKHSLRRQYSDALRALPPGRAWFKFGKPQSNAWLNAISVPSASRNDILAALWGRQIMARPLFTPLHTQAPYSNCICTTTEATHSEGEFRTTILLPSGRLEP